MSILNSHQGHRKRLREKYLEHGLSGFHDYEVLELLLTLNTPRRDCKKSAKALLNKFKTLPQVFEASHESLQSVEGVGPLNSFGVRLIKDVADRYLEYRMRSGNVLKNSNDLIQYLNQFVGYRDQEVFFVLFLDAKNRVITSECLFYGTLTASAVYPREVIKKALEHNAAALIFAHNHPSGDVSPSKEDISLTRQLVFACRHVGIIVHEHLITGKGSVYSFADQGLMASLNKDNRKNDEVRQ